MDSQSLQAFVAVATYQSFSVAAEKLFLTQPAISKRIANLEQQLNCKLFDRISRQVYLTEAGNALLPKANDILQIINDTKLELTNLSGQVGGTLKMAMSHHIGLHRLPPVLRRFSQQHPEVKLEVQFLVSETAEQGIARGDIELAFITLDSQPKASIQAQAVWRDHLYVVAAPTHPLANQDTVTLDDLQVFDAILPDKTTITHQIVADEFTKHNKSLQLALPINFLETIKMMVSVGIGWTVLPESMIDEQLVKLPIKLRIERELGYIAHTQRSLSNAAKAFIALLD